MKINTKIWEGFLLNLWFGLELFWLFLKSILKCINGRVAWGFTSTTFSKQCCCAFLLHPFSFTVSYALHNVKHCTCGPKEHEGCIWFLLDPHWNCDECSQHWEYPWPASSSKHLTKLHINPETSSRNLVPYNNRFDCHGGQLRLHLRGIPNLKMSCKFAISPNQCATVSMLKNKFKRTTHEWKHDKKKKKSKKRLVTHRANTHPSCDLLAAATSWPSPLVDLQPNKKTPIAVDNASTAKITTLGKIDPQS